MAVCRLAFVGDLVPTNVYSQKPSLVEKAFMLLRERIPPDAVLFVNFECALAENIQPGRIACTFEALKAVQAAKPVVVNLANNHHLDAQPHFHKAMLEWLKSAEIPSIGLYENSRPSFDILKINDWRIGILARVAADTMPGQWTLGGYHIKKLNEQSMLEQCRALRPEVDVMIASLHWGDEFYIIPNREQKNFARALVSSGVDIVWGHHAHVLQPRIASEQGVVLYNLGSFLFGEEYPNQWGTTFRRSVVFMYHRNESEVKCREIPMSFDFNGSVNFEKFRPVEVYNCVPSAKGHIEKLMWVKERGRVEIGQRGMNFIKRVRRQPGLLSPCKLAHAFAGSLKRLIRPGNGGPASRG